MARASRAEPRPIPLSGVAGLVAGLGGVRAGVLSGLLGAGASLGQAPHHLWPLTMAALTLFVWQIDGAAGTGPIKRAAGKRFQAGFWRGWCLGFGYFLTGVWWIGSAFLVEADKYGALAPVAIGLLSAGLGLFWGLAGGLAAWAWRRDWRRIVVLATMLFLVEYARGHVLSGFPWNLVGQVWPAGGGISQSASLFGVYGLTLLTLFAFMSPASIASPSKRFAMSVTPPIVSVALFAALFAGGEARLLFAGKGEDTGVHLRVVSPHIDQAAKEVLLAGLGTPEDRDAMRDHYLKLSARPGLDKVTHVIWPETALPGRLLDDPRLLDSIARTLGDGRVLLTGLQRRDVTDPVRPHYFNSFAAIDIERGIPVVAALYDKVKLVPVAERLPFASLAQAIVPQLADFADGYTPGPGKATVGIPRAPLAAPQICYETVFPGFTPRGAERPGWIVNVSNEAWYDGEAGPRQAYNQARYRAIEEGLPVVRAVSGGISAVVDPYGRPVGQLDYGADDVIDAPLPAALRPTLYAMLGDAPVYLMGALCLFVGMTRRRGRA